MNCVARDADVTATCTELPDLNNGAAVLALGAGVADCHALLASYVRCKSQVPSLSGLFVLPTVAHAPHQPLLRGMTWCGQIPASVLHRGRTLQGHAPQPDCTTYDVYHDAARVHKGVVASASLPAAIQTLHSKHDSGLTFVFEFKVSGIPATTL